MNKSELIDQIDQICNDNVTYQTTCRNAGTEYEILIADSYYYHDTYNEFREFLNSHQILNLEDSEGLNENEVYELLTNNMQLKSESCYRAVQDGQFYIACFPIQEIETQISLTELDISKDQAVQIALSNETECYISASSITDDSMLCYNTTDKMWVFYIELDVIKEVLNDYITAI